MTVICLRERSSRTTSRNASGTIGRSAIRHFLNFGSYSSGSASCTRWPTAHVTTWLVGLEVALVLGEGAGEHAREVAPHGGLLGDDERLGHWSQTSGRLSGHRDLCETASRAPARTRLHDRVRDAVSAARAARGGGEDRRHDAAAAVDHRPAGVARAHDPAQRDDQALHRPAAVGVLGHGRARLPQPRGADVVGAVVGEAEDGRRGARARARGRSAAPPRRARRRAGRRGRCGGRRRRRWRPARARGRAAARACRPGPRRRGRW